MAERDEEMIEHIAQTLRDEPLRSPGASFDARVMAAIKWGEKPSRARAFVKWFVRPRSISLSPLAGLAAAAVFAGFAYLGAGAAVRAAMQGNVVTSSAALTAATSQGVQPATHMVQFVFVAPDARSVSLVGDFNDWNAKATPLRSVSGNMWSVEVPLTPGRYNYIFMVDGTRMVPDPAAPRAPADEFGQTTSVVTVGSSSE